VQLGNTTGGVIVTDKNRANTEDEIPGSEIPGHLQKEMHHGMETVTEMGDYALDEAEKMALGIERMPDASPNEGHEPEIPAKPERLSE
jgi:hypothetical protein